jgi:hypothetical protein
MIRPVEWNNFVGRKYMCYINIMGREMGECGGMNTGYRDNQMLVFNLNF